MKKVRNPLIRRLPRELLSDLGPYLVIVILMVAMIGIISGFSVTTESLIKTYNESFDRYNIEDGHFQTEKALNRSQIKEISSYGIQVYENYNVNKETASGTTLRIFADRTEVNLVCLMSGQLPSASDEIAIDRAYAVNNSISVGDTLEMKDGEVFRVSGLVALSDYSCMFENNSDTMFDASLFGVAVVTQEAFSRFPASQINYEYAWLYDQDPGDEKAQEDAAEELLKKLNSSVTLKSFLPRCSNQAINFTGEDFGSDNGMALVFLYIIILILAFVFGITISNTISREANVIGTLLASGFTRGELIRHYMALPVIITLVSALIGNILGYTVFLQYCIDLEYRSYSLTTYEMVWSAQAFTETTVVPLVIMVIITFAILKRKLTLSPQQFLRRDLSHRRKKRGLYLTPRIPFIRRFRLRVIFQNISSYVLLAVGILFANILLLYGLALPDVLNSFVDKTGENMIANYQYILDVPAAMSSSDSKMDELISTLKYMQAVETDNPDAEKFMAYSLDTNENPDYLTDEITLYGIDNDSRYVDLDITGDQVYISSAYAEKYEKSIGDTVNLKEALKDDTYTFTVSGIYDYDSALVLFMSRSYLNSILDYDEDMFAGYFSDTPITDIDEDYIGSIIDLDALTKASRQLAISFGGLVYVLDGTAVVIFIALIYLLSKMIIEKNTQSISMAKILGYRPREIMNLYVMPTAIVTVALIIVGLPFEKWLVIKVFHLCMLYMMNGWLPMDVSPGLLVETGVIGIVSYAVVALIEFRRVRKIPKDIALKNVE